ncbi:endonuclease-reverse transcriptase [Trichonephila clavipes]|nr:endonuclease-reverse transcriptase [Trichonephila clavipes]
MVQEWLYKEPQVTQVIRSNRLRWLGHIWRSPENNQTRAYTFQNPMGSRTRGRPPTSSNSNLVAQRPMRTRAYYAHPSIRDPWALRYEQMPQSGSQSEERPAVFKSPSKLGTHLLTHSCREERVSRLCPDRE